MMVISETPHGSVHDHVNRGTKSLLASLYERESRVPRDLEKRG
jgi:hypothetical protein